MRRGVRVVTGWLAVVWLLGCGVEGPAVGQGPIVASGNATDLALSGRGYFAVSWGSRTEYTRRGEFTVDADGYLVDLERWRVQGYPADAEGALSRPAGDLLVGLATAPPRASELVTIRGNLAADAPLNAMPGFDPLDPSSSSNFRTSVEVHDAFGGAHTLEVYYRKAAAGAWDFHALIDGSALPGGSAGVPTELATGTLTFDATGNLQAVSQGTLGPLLGHSRGVRFDLGDPLNTGGTGVRGLTQFGGTNGVSTTTFSADDGSGPGSLASLLFDDRGQALGVFTNRTVRVLGQVGVALVDLPERLVHTCGAHYAATPLSGPPVLGSPGAGGRASVSGGAREVLDFPSGTCPRGW